MTQPACWPTDAIDVHAHFIPGVYRQAALAAGHARPDGMPGIPPWSVQSAIQLMDRLGIATALLSISSPGVHFGDDVAARQLARAVNIEGADLVRRYPPRFGLFASLPLPDVPGALIEINHAFDDLGADGVVLQSNHQGIYLGDSRFDAVFAALNRRAAVVFVHPTSPHCPACTPALPYPAAMLEFMFETTRAITHLILSGTLQRNPAIKVIVPHAGAALPTLSDRVAGMVPFMTLAQPIASEGVLAQLSRLYFDLAGHAVPRMMSSLLSVADTRHLLYGSDCPFTPEPVAAKFVELLSSSPQLDEADRARIARENALGLFARLNSLASAR